MGSRLLVKRQIDLLKALGGIAVNYEREAQNTQDVGILSMELRYIDECIKELVGIVSKDDVVHNIFENFCIGK